MFRYLRANKLPHLCLCLALLPLAAGAADPDASEGATLDCVINPSVVADLGSAVPGVLSDVRVDRSDFVEKGAVLAELESGAEAATVELARARAGLTAEVDLRRANAAFGDRQHERSKDLFARKVISTNEIDERRTEARVANIQLRQALDNQRLAKLELVRAKEILSRRVIHSPISGVVMERFKSIGEYVEDKPVVRVAQLDPLHVEVIVPVEQLGQVRPGMRASVWSEAVGGDGWEATVSRVDRVADVASGTYGVRLALPNPDNRIPAGLRCQMSWLAEAPAPLAAEEPLSAPEPPALQVAEEPASAPEPLAAEESPSASEPPAAVVDGEIAEAATPPVAVEDNTPESEPTAAVTEDTVVAEATPEPQPEMTTETEVALPACRSVGPFSDDEKARQQAQALRAQGLDVAMEAHPVPVQRGYQIVSAPLPDRAAANRMIERLQNAGIDDYFLMARKEPLEIALGLYKSKGRAADRADRLKARGFDVRIAPWMEDRDQVFLAIRGTIDETVGAALEVLPQPDPGAVPANSLCERLAGR